MRNLLFLFVALGWLAGCKHKSCQIDPAIATVNINLKIERLEKSLYASKAKQDVRQFLQANPSFVKSYLQTDLDGLDDNFVNALYSVVTNPQLRKFVADTDKTFGDLASPQRDLETAFKHIKYYYPETTVPPVKTYSSGLLGPDLVVNDSLIVLGLDYFAGKQARYRPQQPAYILARYQPANLVPAVVLQLSAKYNQTQFENRSMLAQMIYYGKSYYFTERVLPCTSDSLIIGYSAQQQANVQYNEGKIWAHIVEKNLLFETSHFKTSKYLEERPNVPEISAQCPGRIGRWVGWQIVRKYMAENPQVTLPQLMAEQDAQKIFNASRYKPKRRN